MRSFRHITNKYYLSDSRQIERILPNLACIDVTITSPPYWNLKNYGYKGQVGFGQSYEEYLDDIAHIFNIVYERTKNSGSLWIISDTLKHNGELKLIPFDIAQLLQESGWILQDIIIWEKDKTLPWSHQGKLRNIFEYITFFTKTKDFKYHVAAIRDILDMKKYWVRYPERYSPKGKAPARKWKFSIPLQGSWAGSNGYLQHVCPLPPALIERILRLTTNKGDIVLDPFAGSGSVLATARAMKRKYIGFDLSDKDKSTFHDRVLPSLLNEFTSKDGEITKSKNASRRFSTLIKGLRMLKFPKEVLRLYRKNRQLPECLGALVLLNKQPDRLKVFFIFPTEKSIPKKFEETIVQLSLSPPLSKYGITPTFGVLTKSQLSLENCPIMGLEATTNLYVYRHGRFYAWDDKTYLRDLPILLNNKRKETSNRFRYPPIVSTIKISVDPNDPFKALEGQNGKKSKEETQAS